LEKADAVEATPLIQRMLTTLLSIIPDKGRPGSDARRAIGDLMASTYVSLYDGTLGPALVNCLDLVRLSGVALPMMGLVRLQLEAEAPFTLGATMVRDYALNMVLAEQALIITNMTFNSRQDVDELIMMVQMAFTGPEESTADNMDSETYRGLIELRASLINHLVTVGLPLPEMLVYEFAVPMPSLLISQRLYADTSRYEEIRNENKVVHPLFCPIVGQALSA